jgi:N-acetylmuramoyl-L-alanine amidase
MAIALMLATLSLASQSSFAGEVRLAFRADPPERRYEVSAPIKPVAAKRLPKIVGPNDKSLPLVVLDAGHGGYDPGAVSPHGGAREKDVTLAIARAIRSELLKTGRVRVALTRDSDQFLVLQDRYGVARRMNADLFISIHADSAENPEASGGTVYTLSEVASEQIRHHQWRKSRRRGCQCLVDPDRPYPARDNECFSRFRKTFAP